MSSTLKFHRTKGIDTLIKPYTHWGQKERMKELYPCVLRCGVGGDWNEMKLQIRINTLLLLEG